MRRENPSGKPPADSMRRFQRGSHAQRSRLYARVKREWCLAIRIVNGNEADPDRENEEVWPFNDAPRYLRIKAVDKLPELIEALIEATNATAKRLSEKVAPAQEIAATVNALLNQKKK